MSEKLTFNTKEDEGEYKVPEFYNANWRDDIPEEKEDEEKNIFKFELIGGSEKGEKEYSSPEKISKRAEELLHARNLKIGKKVFELR